MQRWLLIVLAALALAAPAGAQAQTVVAAAGDIACAPDAAGFNGGLGTLGADARCHQKYTSDLFAALQPAAVLALGDLQYQTGALDDFETAYDREDAAGEPMSWGRAKAITRPVPGNHEYADRDPDTGEFNGAQGYFDYFNGAGVDVGPAGERGKGYYSFDLPAGTRADGSPVTWHLVALNSQCASDPPLVVETGWLGGCDAGSPQEQWLRQDLAAAAAAGTECVLAYMHHPRFSAVGAGDDAAMAGVWQALYDGGADLALSGHHHLYQRFGPLDAAGVLAPGRGVRSFVVGTGGIDLGQPPAFSREAEAIDFTTFGVLALTLHDGWYEWEFVDDGRSGSFTDAGRGSCVKPPTAIVSGPEGLVADSTPTFAYAGSRSTATFECRLDAGAWQPCASPVTYPAVADGAHAFSVRALDFAGAGEPTPPARAFTVDTTPPAVGLSAPRPGTVLTGAVPLSAEAADATGVVRVDWVLDGEPIASATTAPFVAAWDSATVADGRRRLRARAIDAAGNATTSARVVAWVGNRPLRSSVSLRGSRRLRSLARGGLRLRVRCSRPCRVDARMTVGRRAARRLSLRPLLARAADRRLLVSRTRLRLRPRPAVRRALRRATALRASLRFRVVDGGGNRRAVRRTITLR